jgi:hypothetical protein
MGAHAIRDQDSNSPFPKEVFSFWKRRIFPLYPDIPRLERLGLSVKLTTKVTRDAYATTLKKGNVSIEKIAEMLGHSSTMVTKNHLDSFDQEQFHEINQVLP